MKLRADQALVMRGIAPDLHLARALIMAGRVLYGDNRVVKPSESISKPELIRIRGVIDSYVSRGAHKLQKAFEVFDIAAAGKTCIDIGAATGGFTEVMLRHDAAKVFAVDVGFNLLDWKLRSDPRVVCMEKTNARFLEKSMFECEPDFGATDVSFISLKAVLPAIKKVLRNGADFIALIKPQFEAAKEEVGAKGVVRDSAVHRKVIADICAFVYGIGYSIYGLDFSPIRGPEGNIEFLLHLNNSAPDINAPDTDMIGAVVENAGRAFSSHE